MSSIDTPVHLPLAPIATGSQESDRKANLVYILGWVWALIGTAFMCLLMVMLPQFWMRAVKYIFILDTCIFICLVVNRSGHFKAAAILLLLSLWATVSHMALTAGGINSVSVIIYLPIIVTAGLLLGGRWGIMTSGLCMLTALGMALLDMRGMLPARQVIHTPLTLWMGYTCSGVLIAIMQYMAMRQSRIAYEQMMEAKNELRLLNGSLEKKVAERTAELHDANIELETFNYSVSHDLQAPLRLVNGFAKVLLKDYWDRLDDTGRHSLQVITTNTVRMSQLVRDLLEFSKSGKAHLTKEEVDMKGIVLTIIDEVKMGHDHFAAEMVVHDLSTSSSDAHLIKQVWANLILNAVKFSATRPQPVIEIGYHTQEGHHVYYIRDNGVGFDMDQSAKLFNPFQRLHDKAAFEGSGVGLATTHRIITRHGGKIWAEAQVDQGATFYFSLPN